MRKKSIITIWLHSVVVVSFLVISSFRVISHHRPHIKSYPLSSRFSASQISFLVVWLRCHNVHSLQKETPNTLSNSYLSIYLSIHPSIHPYVALFTSSMSQSNLIILHITHTCWRFVGFQGLLFLCFFSSWWPFVMFIDRWPEQLFLRQN